MLEPTTDKEKMLVARERERALRCESVTKKAINVANGYKKAYTQLKEENTRLKKGLSQDKKLSTALMRLDDETRSEVRVCLRKAFHPDKHNQASDTSKKVLASLFDYFENVLGTKTKRK